MSELMLVGVLKLIARNEELERAVGTLRAEIEKLKEPKAPPPKESEGNEDG